MPSPQDGNGQALETPFGETLVLEPTSPGRAETRKRPPALTVPRPGDRRSGKLVKRSGTE
jgi:hypothetical protein